MCTGARVSERERERETAPAPRPRHVNALRASVCVVTILLPSHRPSSSWHDACSLFLCRLAVPRAFPDVRGAVPVSSPELGSALFFALLLLLLFFFFLALSFLLGFLLYPPSPCCSPAWPLLPWRSTAATSPGCTVMGERSRWCVGPEARLPFFVSLFFFFPSATIA